MQRQAFIQVSDARPNCNTLSLFFRPNCRDNQYPGRRLAHTVVWVLTTSAFGTSRSVTLQALSSSNPETRPFTPPNAPRVCRHNDRRPHKSLALL